MATTRALGAYQALAKSSGPQPVHRLDRTVGATPAATQLPTFEEVLRQTRRTSFKTGN